MELPNGPLSPTLGSSTRDFANTIRMTPLCDVVNLIYRYLLLQPDFGRLFFSSFLIQNVHDSHPHLLGALSRISIYLRSVSTPSDVDLAH